MVAWYWFVIAYFVGIIVTLLIEVLVNVICSIPLVLHRMISNKWFKH